MATALEPGKFRALETVKLSSDGGVTAVRICGSEATRGVIALRFMFEDGPPGYNLYRKIIVVGEPAANP